jgi:benzoyl-CoA reductase/2-hydroxyglutaryl-CoA dehydratase subunit BcrC/BadD/HgdB
MARPKLYTKVEDMEKIIKKYFDECDKKEKPYTMSGLAYALDMDRKSLLNYSKDEKFFPTIKKAKEKVEQQLEENALSNKSNSTFTIFNLKNNFGWKDTIIQENKEISKVDELLEELKNNANK